MTRKVLINQTVKSIKKLPDSKLREVSDYVEFLLYRMDDNELSNQIARAASTSKAFQFLEDEEDLYIESDLKEVYK
jgi:hypothetical protein